METKKCTSLSGHEYKARYDYGTPTLSDIRGVTGDQLVKIIEATRPITYVQDICVNCGDVVGRE